MSDAFHSARFGKNVWLTNHVIESMAKRNVTLAEVKRLIEEGQYTEPKRLRMAGSSTISSLGRIISCVQA